MFGLEKLLNAMKSQMINIDTTIRRAKPEDGKTIARIRISAWNFAYRDIIPNSVLNSQSIEKDSVRQEQSIRDGKQETYLLESGKKDIGFLTIGESRDEDKNSSSFELWGIYIDPVFIRAGYGSKLIQYCESEAIRRNKKEITLWVLEKNKIGRSFYSKHGYNPDGKEKYLENIQSCEIRYCKAL